MSWSLLKIEADAVVGLLAINCVRCTLVWTVKVRAFVSTPERAAWWVADVEDSIVMSSQ